MLFHFGEAGGRWDNDNTVLLCPSHSNTVLRWLTSSCWTFAGYGEGPTWLDETFCVWAEKQV